MINRTTEDNYDSASAIEEIVRILDELKSQLGEKTCVSCDELLIDLGAEHLCVALELMNLNPRLCCTKAREHCDNDCCRDKLTQVLALLNPENRKLQADDLLMVLLILGVSTDDINPQRMLLALEYLNQVRFERWVLCRISQYCNDRAADPQLYPGWVDKPLPVQVIEAAASLGVVPHDIPRRLVYPMLAAGNFSDQDQENLLTIYTETMNKKAEADIAEVVYLLFTYRPERRKDLWSSFERQFKMFSSALGTSLDIENAALSFYGGDFGLGVVAETVKTAAEKVDMAKLLEEDSLVPKLKNMELATKDEVFVAAVFSLAKREDQARIYYWTASKPIEYKPLGSKGLTGKTITGVAVRNGKDELIGAALIEFTSDDTKKSPVDYFQLYLNQSYNLLPMIVKDNEQIPCPGAKYTLVQVDFNAELVSTD